MLEDTSQLIAGRRGAVCRGLEKPLYRLYQVLVNSRSVEEGEAQIEFARGGSGLRYFAIPLDRLIRLARALISRIRLYALISQPNAVHSFTWHSRGIVESSCHGARQFCSPSGIKPQKVRYPR